MVEDDETPQHPEPYVLLRYYTPISRLVALRRPAPSNRLRLRAHSGCATFG